ncbi:Protein Star [Armadillidium vulgare]|nr:Protein Star [Armadillidium vulgare]
MNEKIGDHATKYFRIYIPSMVTSQVLFWLETLDYQENPKVPNEEAITVLLSDIMKAPATLEQDDPPILISKIRKRYLIAPSTLPYNLEDGSNDPSQGQAAIIRKLLKEKGSASSKFTLVYFKLWFISVYTLVFKRNGFFIECGALDGETRSNSLVFEKWYGWEGVLIEGDPKNFKLVLQKNRKAWSVPACLSTLAYPNVVMFKQNFNLGKISDVPVGNESHKEGLVEVQCLPIYSILLALNRTTIDYFSLDVEGHELEVLQTIPWNKVNIITLSVEFCHGKSGKNGLKSFMESKGYKVYTNYKQKSGLNNDLIFYHPLLLK